MYSWEHPSRRWDFHSGPLDECPEESDDEGEAVGEAAGALLVEFLLDQLYKNQMSARAVCTICFWAAKAGAQGIDDFALRPDSPSGHFQRKIDKATRVDLKEERKRAYTVPTPLYTKHDMSRSVHPMMVQLPHVQLAEEVASNPRAASGPLEAEWTEAFSRHPVVLENPSKVVMPYALYMDGVSFTLKDSMLGIFVYSLHTLKRHLCCVLRRSYLCKCSCHGWCTLYPIFRVLRWSFEQLARGTYPEQDIDGPWPANSVNADRAGELLGFIGALLHIKGDWSEYSHTMGFADWNSRLFCCMFCKATKDNRFAINGFSPFSDPWGALVHGDLEKACEVAELWRHLSAEQHTRVKAALHYDKSKDGAHGRCVKIDIPELKLKKGDRLEPFDDLVDVAQFDRLSVFPCKVLFWRRGLETRCKHRNPLLDARGGSVIGATLDTIQVDVMHTLHLGPAQLWVVSALWMLILADVFLTGCAGDQLHQVSAMHIRNALWSWYKERRVMSDTEITEIQDFTLLMIGGKPSSQALHTKAAETKGLVPFVLNLVKQHLAKLPKDGGRYMLAAGEAMQLYFELLDSSPRIVPAATIQRMYNAVKRHISLCKLAGIPLKPKHHLLLHLVARTAKHGSPRYYSTFEDEGVNKMLKHVGQAAHRSVWEIRVFLHFGRAELTRGHKRGRAADV